MNTAYSLYENNLTLFYICYRNSACANSCKEAVY